MNSKEIISYDRLTYLTLPVKRVMPPAATDQLGARESVRVAAKRQEDFSMSQVDR
jgi:hypothetical protein